MAWDPKESPMAKTVKKAIIKQKRPMATDRTESPEGYRRRADAWESGSQHSQKLNRLPLPLPDPGTVNVVAPRLIIFDELGCCQCPRNNRGLELPSSHWERETAGRGCLHGCSALLKREADQNWRNGQCLGGLRFPILRSHAVLGRAHSALPIQGDRLTFNNY